VKIYNLIKCFVFVTAFSLISGCKSDSSITVYTSQNKQIAQITDNEELEGFLENWKQRRVVLVKKMPDFSYKIVIVEGDQSSEWKYSAGGYITSTKKADNDIYKVEFSKLNQIIKNK